MRKLALLPSLLLILSSFSAYTMTKKPNDESTDGSVEQPTEKTDKTVYPTLNVWDGSHCKYNRCNGEYKK